MKKLTPFIAFLRHLKLSAIITPILFMGICRAVSAQTDEIEYIKKITAADRYTDDGFSKSVSVSGDIMVVGASGQDYDSAGGDSISWSGAAYVFHRNQGGAGNWGFVKKLTGEWAGTNGRITGDRFGWSVSVSGDVIVVGGF